MADHVLVIQDAEHGHQAENVALAVHHFLTIQDAEHGHIATDYALSLPGVIVVNEWTPADAEENVNQGRTVQVDFEARFTEELEALYDEGQDFIDGGTLAGAAVVGDQLQLATESTPEDFETPRHSEYADITASNHWTKVSTNGLCEIRNDIAGEDNQYARYQQYNQGGVWSFDDFGAAEADVNITARVRFEDDSGRAGLAGRITGTGSGTRGYVLWLSANDNQVGISRLNGGGGGSGLYGLAAVAYAVVADQWYRVRLFINGSWIGAKVWLDGDPEPAGWNTSTTNTVHAGPGAVGLWFQNGTANYIKQTDDFSVSTVPASYEALGTWESDPLELASVNRYSSSTISWDETTPAGTTVTVSIRKNGAGLWVVQTNGAELFQLYAYDKFMAFESLEVRVKLETTDDNETPTVENLRLYFDPCKFEDLEIIVDALPATAANGKLFAWGKRQVTATVEHEGWNDLHADAARLGWYNHPAAGQSLSAELKYNAVSIDSITFSADTIPVKENIGGIVYFIMPALALESSPRDNVHEWTPQGHDINSNRVFEWVVIDKGVNIRADAYYYVGHPTRVDVPSSLLAAQVALDDYLSSSLVEGYRPDDYPSSSLAQARRRDDFPSSLLPAIVTLEDFIGATVVAIRRLDDEPSSLVVYGVNRENVLELHVISESTYTALTGEGVSWT